MTAVSMEVRFWSKVNKLGPIPSHRRELGQCWEWTGGSTSQGYGRVYADGTNKYAHRVAFKIETGSYPTLCVLHKCDNPSCVRFSHFYQGTRATNNEDCIKRGRRSSTRGQNNPNVKLAPADVVAIRTLRKAGVMGTVVASIFGVTTATVSDIVVGKRWSHL